MVRPLHTWQGYIPTEQHGYCNIYGLTAQQHPNDVLWWGQELIRIQPQQVIALGCADAGFETFFGLYGYLTGCAVDVYDRNTPQYQEIIEIFGATVHITEIYRPDIQQQIQTQIAKPGRSLVLCDAHKRQDFALAAPALKAGDIIAVHDYGPTAPRNGWKWVECTWRHIAAPAKKYNIVPYEHYPEHGAWGVFIKSE